LSVDPSERSLDEPQPGGLRSRRMLDESLLPRADEVWSWTRLVDAEFGPQRLTGDRNHARFVDWLERRFADLGCSVQRDRYTFTRWEASLHDDVAVTITEANSETAVALDVLSYVPYSGSTLLEGAVNGRLIYLPADGRSASEAVALLLANPPADLASSVVAVECPCPRTPAATVWHMHPPDLELQKPVRSPPYQMFSGVREAHAALDRRCQAAMYCWTDVSDESARFQYVPFGMKVRNTPAVWVGRHTATNLRLLAEQDARVTLRLDARVFPNTPTDTLIATLPGTSDEIIVLGSHTDGCNIGEENGSLGLLAVATEAAKRHPSARNRTLVFILATGHFAREALADEATATGPYGQPGADAEGAWRDHPDIVSKTVAAVAIEHLGCMEWLDNPAATAYLPTGRPTADTWFVGSQAAGTTTAPEAANQLLAELTVRAARPEPEQSMRTQVEQTGQPSPETRPAGVRGIPSVGLIPIPTYLLDASPGGVIDRLSPALMHAQVRTTARLLSLLDTTSVELLRGVAVGRTL
jgi:hypothetical protein